jgi:hypothetical protein
MSAVREEYIPAPRKLNFTFAGLVQGREVEFPTLARAARNTQPAHDVVIEWLVDGPNGPERWRNFTQIVRWPYKGATEQGARSRGSDENSHKAVVAFLRCVDETLRDGRPHRETTGMPIAWCGGYRHYLGRELTDSDILVLRPLREPFLWTHDWKFRDREWVELYTPEYEWLAEFSLEVIPGK